MNDRDLRERITALEQEVRALRIFEAAPYRAVVEDMSELVVRWHPDGTRLFVNDAYCRMFGAPREALLGTSFWSLVSEVDRARVQERIRRLNPQQPVSAGRHRVQGPDGRTFWMEWCDRALFDSDGKVTEFQSVGRDITERIELEEHVRRIEQADAVARASASIAHDLANVLLVIGGFFELVRDGADVKRHRAEAAESALEEARALLDQLRNLRYGLPFKPVPVDLSARITALLEVLRELAGQHCLIVARCGPGPCRIRGDATQIDQILLNLVRNAADASSSCTIELTTASIPVSELHPDHHWPKGAPTHCSVVRVNDTAGGIPPAVLPKIFEPHVTTKPSGQGLGLATVKAVVDAHGGSVRVETSTIGTRFEIAFPDDSSPFDSSPFQAGEEE